MSQVGIEPASPSLNTVNRKKVPASREYRANVSNLIIDTLGHIYRGRRSRYSNSDTLGSSIELKCDVKSDFSYDTYGTVPSIELNCYVKFDLTPGRITGFCGLERSVPYRTTQYRIVLL
jgi:hypothetical protein